MIRKAKSCISGTKLLPSLLLMCFVMLLVTSCEEDEKIQVTETIEVTLFKNQSYSYTLPSNQSDDPFEITDQASHAIKSELGFLGSAVKLTYYYTPEINFKGKDRVVIANVEEEKQCGNGGGKSGPCGKDKEQQTQRTIIININVVDNNSKQ